LLFPAGGAYFSKQFFHFLCFIHNLGAFKLLDLEKMGELFWYNLATLNPLPVLDPFIVRNRIGSARNE
jgi:hypothetical protein